MSESYCLTQYVTESLFSILKKFNSNQNFITCNRKRKECRVMDTKHNNKLLEHENMTNARSSHTRQIFHILSQYSPGKGKPLCRPKLIKI